MLLSPSPVEEHRDGYCDKIQCVLLVRLPPSRDAGIHWEEGGVAGPERYAWTRWCIHEVVPRWNTPLDRLSSPSLGQRGATGLIFCSQPKKLTQ